MSRLKGRWPALLALAAFAFSGALWAAADLGTADAEREYRSLPANMPLSVYARPEAGAPKLTDDAIKGWRSAPGVRCALPVAEAHAVLSGPGWALDAQVCQVQESALASSGIAPASGRLPRSAWQTEALLGSALAGRLAQAAASAGLAAPDRIRLAIAADEGSEEAPRYVDALISGIAKPTGTASDGAVWLDAGLALAPVRCDVYMDGVSEMADFAEKADAAGYLAVNPLAAQARVLAEGRSTARQWAWITVLSGVAALAAAWLRLGGAGFIALPAAALAAAAGMLAAAALVQCAMLLGLRFLAGDGARYLLDAPRILAIFASCEAITVLFTFFLPYYPLPFHPVKGV
jgi:hypothetical protein